MVDFIDADTDLEAAEEAATAVFEEAAASDFRCSSASFIIASCLPKYPVYPDRLVPGWGASDVALVVRAAEVLSKAASELALAYLDDSTAVEAEAEEAPP